MTFMIDYSSVKSDEEEKQAVTKTLKDVFSNDKLKDIKLGDDGLKMFFDNHVIYLDAFVDYDRCHGVNGVDLVYTVYQRQDV